MEVLRDASLHDAVALVRLLDQLGYRATVDEVERRLSMTNPPMSGVVVVETSTGTVGFASYDTWFAFADGEHVCRLSALCVAPEARRLGLGRRLVLEIEHRAVSLGCGTIELSSGRRAERESAHAFYPSLGYDDRCQHHAMYAKSLELGDQ